MHRRALHTLADLVCGGSDAPAAELERALVGSERVSVLVSLREPAWSPNRLTRARNLEALRARVLSRSGNAFHAPRQYRQVAALSGSITADDLEVPRRDPEVRDIQLDMIGHGALAEAVPAIGADTVQRMFKVTGRGVRVAVLDTGVEQGADNRGVNTSWVAATQKSEVSGCSISGRQSATRATPGCGGGPRWRSARSYGGVQSVSAVRRVGGPWYRVNLSADRVNRFYLSQRDAHDARSGGRLKPSRRTRSQSMSIINSKIPAFKVQAYHNDAFKTVSNEDLLGKWSILFFYPADFTFVCPTELGDLADKYSELQKLGVEVYSVSTDTHFTHKAWHDASETIKKIKYPMLADPTAVLARAFGVYIEEEGLAYRGTFLINPEGQIKVAEIHDNGIGRSSDELLRKVQAAQYTASHPGEVCPAKWKPGAQTLKPGLNLVGKI